MKTKQLHAAMISICSLHVLQGVYDECEGTQLFSQKRKQLAKNLLTDVEHYFNSLLNDDETQMQFNNAANAIELLAKWLIDNQGSEEESAKQLGEKIASIFTLMGHEVENLE